MQVTDILRHTGGLQSMARELGISESQAASDAAALAPADSRASADSSTSWGAAVCWMTSWPRSPPT
jgi:hypothetical protein